MPHLNRSTVMFRKRRTENGEQATLEGVPPLVRGMPGTRRKSFRSFGRLMCLSGNEWRVLMRSGRFASRSRHTIAGASSMAEWEPTN